MMATLVFNELIEMYKKERKISGGTFFYESYIYLKVLGYENTFAAVSLNLSENLECSQLLKSWFK